MREATVDRPDRTRRADRHEHHVPVKHFHRFRPGSGVHDLNAKRVEAATPPPYAGVRQFAGFRIANCTDHDASPSADLQLGGDEADQGIVGRERRRCSTREESPRGRR